MKIVTFFREVDRLRVLRVSCVLALIALGLIIWSLLDPRPIPVILAMSVAQGLGTLSFLAFLLIVARDLRIGSQISAKKEKSKDGVSSA